MTARASRRRVRICSSASGGRAIPGKSGFGIGLALARWVTERHDGAISLGAGEDGKGARVTLVLPILDLDPGDGQETKRKDSAA